jgi:hypothetical protein
VRRFVLNRLEDASGVSGTGIVAEGIQFSNGMVAVCFLTGPALHGRHRSVIAYWSIQAVEEVHGHGGKTVIDWVDQ